MSIPVATQSEQSPAPVWQQQPPTNTLSILAIVLVWFFWPAGLILGHVARRQIDRSGENGRGMATAAVVVGWACFALTVLVTVVGLIAISHLQ